VSKIIETIMDRAKEKRGGEREGGQVSWIPFDSSISKLRLRYDTGKEKRAEVISNIFDL